MSATLLADGTTSSLTASIDTDYLAPVVPIRRSAPVRPGRRLAPAPVSRRAGARGPRYAQASPASDWHLSRRGELLLRRLTAVVTAVVVILVLTAAAFAVVGTAGSAPVQTRAVVVQPGQSLWQLARASSPGADVSEATDQIRSLNHLGTTELIPGQTLIVPVTH